MRELSALNAYVDAIEDSNLCGLPIVNGGQETRVFGGEVPFLI